MRRLIRADGTTEDLPKPLTVDDIVRIIKAPGGLDTVRMRHMGNPVHVMCVDDTGLIDGRPVNEEATTLYHLNCKPGTGDPICGDVVVVPDSDFR